MTHSAVIRRSLPPAAVLRRSLSSLVPALSSPPLLKPSISYSSPSSLQQPSSFLASIVQSRLLRSYPTVSLSSDKKYHLYKEGDEITPDTILFEGCDYNHWLIVMEFPKDPKPTPEEMVRTYEETCAKGLNISLEEAKQKIYACSTTTYQGFQAVMTEEESEKFQGLPGVVFVLPDSYIDPQNKEYGGDKYINGTIIPRPPPIQRNTGGRFRDRNRNPDRPPRYNQQGGPMQNQQIYPQNNSWQGDVRNPGAPQNYPQQQNYSPQQNYPPEQNYSPQQNYPPERNSPPQQNYPPQQSFGTPGQGVSGGPMPMNRSGRESFPVDRRGSVPPYPGNYNQGEKGKYYSPQGDQSGYGQRNFVGNNSNYAPPSHGGTYGQEDQSNYGPRNFMGNNSNYAPPSHGGTYGQGVSSNYGQSYRGQGENQRFSPMDQGNVQGDQRNYAPTGQTGTNQG